MKSETILALDELFGRMPVLKAGGPVSPQELDDAERRVGVPLPPDYREFVQRYGGAIVGSLPIFGLRNAEAMADRDFSVVDMTKRMRADRWEPTDEWAVISLDLGGNPIGINSAGEVWISDHDFGEVWKLADTFEAFVLLQLSGC